MKLQNAKNQDDINYIYEINGIRSTPAKIQFLREQMKILSSSFVEEDLEDELIGLEELVLTHLWEGLSNEN